MAALIKTLLFAVVAVFAITLAAEDEREKKEVIGLGLPGVGYYGGYGRSVLPYAGYGGLGHTGLGYAAHPGYAGLGYAGYRGYGLGYPGYAGYHGGYHGGYPYYGGYGAYPYIHQQII